LLNWSKGVEQEQVVTLRMGFQSTATELISSGKACGGLDCSAFKERLAKDMLLAFSG